MGNTIGDAIPFSDRGHVCFRGESVLVIVLIPWASGCEKQHYRNESCWQYIRTNIIEMSPVDSTSGQTSLRTTRNSKKEYCAASIYVTVITFMINMPEQLWSAKRGENHDPFINSSTQRTLMWKHQRLLKHTNDVYCFCVSCIYALSTFPSMLIIVYHLSVLHIFRFSVFLCKVYWWCVLLLH